LIEWRLLQPAERAEREQRTVAAADAFAKGQSPLAPLSPAWDQEMMDFIADGAWPRLAALADDEITRAGGRSAHEVRTWLAAFSALGAYGAYQGEQSVYFEAPEWIVGYGALRARSMTA
jgi:2,3-dihydroxyphenylpropionate 1,2-dioxygenase